MKATLLLGILIAASTVSVRAQDGSDIMYLDEHEIDSMLVGRMIHIDFDRRSFGGFDRDTVSISIDGEDVLFEEIRQETGFNNWFFDQYLASITSFEGKQLRVEHMEVMDVDEAHIGVNLYLRYYDRHGAASSTSARVLPATFNRSTINQVLVLNKENR